MNERFDREGLSEEAMTGTVLIAGCGYIGLRAARRFVADNHMTFAITRSGSKADAFKAEGINPIILDLGSTPDWPKLPRVDVLLWSVGYERVPGQDRTAVWIDGLNHLLDVLLSRPTAPPLRVIYTSSTGIYGDGAGTDVEESTAATPVTEGGKACLAAETLLSERAAAGQFEAVILRLAGIYGPDRLLRRVTELFNGTPITSPADDWLNLIHADDAVRAIELVAFHSQLFQLMTNNMLRMNVVAGSSVTRRQYYETLASIANAPAPVFSESPAGAVISSGRGRSGNRRVISSVRRQLDLSYQYDDLRSGLTDAVNRSQKVTDV